MKVYIASKVKYAKIWKKITDVEIVSRWIHEAGPGESNLQELAEKCILDVGRSDLLVLYCEPGDLLKGALIEMGAAIALNIPVIVIGQCDSISTVFMKHKRVYSYEEQEEGFSALKPICDIFIRSINEERTETKSTINN